MALAGNPTRLTGTGEIRRSFAEVMPVATDTADKPGILVFMIHFTSFVRKRCLFGSS
jgi:hypothetical protein